MTCLCLTQALKVVLDKEKKNKNTFRNVLLAFQIFVLTHSAMSLIFGILIY